ncbi:hypothetical protein HZS_1059, partial [Henneguya salminicola]
MSSGSEQTWALWFCSRRGNEFFCEVDDDFLFDRFNSTGIQDLVPQYDEAMEFMNEAPLDIEHTDKSIQPASVLYGLIHARFLLTSRGQQQMIIKYKSAEFGTCNLYNCDNQPYLPVGMTYFVSLGLSDTPNVSTVKMYCPKCENIFLPKSNRHLNLDGAYFGTTFPHLLFMIYPEYRPTLNKSKYIPRIYGFQLHQRAMQYQYEQAGKKTADHR